MNSKAPANSTTGNPLKLFRRSLSICFANAKAFLTLGAFAMVPAALAAFANPPLLAQLASIIVSEIVFAATIYAAAKAVSGEAPNGFESLRAVRDRLAELLELLVRQWGSMILLAITVLGIPFAIRILVRWFFGTQGVVLRSLDAKGAINLSCRLAERRWWRLALLMLIMLLVVAAPSTAAYLLLGRAASLAVSIPQALVLAPPLACFWTLLFLDLEERTRAGEPAPVPAS